MKIKYDHMTGDPSLELRITVHLIIYQDEAANFAKDSSTIIYLIQNSPLHPLSKNTCHFERSVSGVRNPSECTESISIDSIE
jgi:hypothetical protein